MDDGLRLGSFLLGMNAPNQVTQEYTRGKHPTLLKLRPYFLTNEIIIYRLTKFTSWINDNAI